MIDFVANEEVRIGEYDCYVSLDSDKAVIVGYEDDFILKQITPMVFRQIENSYFEGKAKVMMRCLLYQKYKMELSDGPSAETSSSLIDYF